jgi:hypothetical protein
MSNSREGLRYLSLCLEDMSTVEYSDMLKALIVKGKEVAGTRILKESNADKDYSLLAKSAIDFCNGTSSLCEKMKKSFRSA